MFLQSRKTGPTWPSSEADVGDSVRYDRNIAFLVLFGKCPMVGTSAGGEAIE